MKRTLVTTDIHGCFDEMMDMFELVKYDPINDDLLVLGDLTDKNSAGVGKVADELYHLQKQYKNIIVIASNHDDKHVRYQRNEEKFHQIN